MQSDPDPLQTATFKLLHSRSEIDLSRHLGDREAIKKPYSAGRIIKPMTHRLSEGELMVRDMGHRRLIMSEFTHINAEGKSKDGGCRRKSHYEPDCH